MHCSLSAQIYTYVKYNFGVEMNFENIAFFSFVELGKYSDIIAVYHSPKLDIYIYIPSLHRVRTF